MQGMVRAEQDQLQDGTGATAVALLIHGDAAFAGLGIVAECLQLSNLPGNDMFCSCTCELQPAFHWYVWDMSSGL